MIILSLERRRGKTRGKNPIRVHIPTYYYDYCGEREIKTLIPIGK